MESLRTMIQQIGERFRLLDTSQKVAIALCVVVIVGSLVSLMSWSVKPELVPIAAKDFTLDQMDAAEEALNAAGIRFERTGSRLMVREEDRYNAIRVLNKSDALPEDFEFGFASLLNSDTTFQQSSVLQHQRKVALGYELAKVIASSPVVESAFVLIQQQDKRTIGQPRVRPTASVKITMRGSNQITPAVVDGCAKLVSHAVAGLQPHDVTVFDTKSLKSYSAKNPDELLETGLLAARKENEQHLLSKVMTQLSYIPGVLASVSVELDGSKSRTESISYTEPAVKSEETRTSKSGSSSSPGEPGVNPNTGVALNATGSGTQSETEDSLVENYSPNVTERRVEDKAPFDVRRATAAINIPRSYIVGVFKTRNPDAKEVRDDEVGLVTLRDEIFATVRNAVMRIIPAKADDDVQVAMFHDVEGAGGMIPGAPGMPGGDMTASAVGGTTQTLKTYAPQIGLAAMAMFSLMMMMRMVRKTTRTTRGAFPMLDDDDGDDFAMAPDGVLAVPGGPVGQAETSEGFLMGHEVDEETLQNQQLDEQIARLVDDNPDGVADLLRRWVEQSD